MIDKSKKILVIVESPNKCSHIQEYLKKAGYNARVITSVVNIMELANGDSYYNTVSIQKMISKWILKYPTRKKMLLQN